MPLTKEEKANILANIVPVFASQQGIDRVAKAVLEGDFTELELQNTGQLTPNDMQKLQSAIKKNKAEVEEDRLWQQAQQLNTISAYQEYLDTYRPNGKYVTLAETLIAGLKAVNDNLTKEQYINALKQDINAYNTVILNSYGITYQDLIDAGIRIPDSIKRIWNDSGIDLQIGETPDSIPSGRTEIYFWGAPGSGKTCTISALLSTAKRLGYFIPQQGDGLMYMTQLSNLFIDEAATLPPPTAIEVTQGLSFDLREKDLTSHPVTLIELSGEIFECFSQAIMGQELPNDGHLTAYNSLLKFLGTTQNPKYHFFVIDVNNKKRDSYGLTQMDYLQNAALFFQQNQIFNSSTAGINILVTKSDLLGKTAEDRKSNAIRTLEERYKNFVNQLKIIAYNHQLIRRQQDPIPVIPFTLGDVYLQTKCIFDPTMSEEIIKMLQQNVSRAHVRRRTNWLNW